MKKIYVAILAVIASFAVSASGTVKLGLNTKRMVNENGVARHSQPSNSINQVTGSLICNSNYVAGTTQTLDFVLTLTNTDAEYGDSLALTFPAGMTPTGTTNQPNFDTTYDNAAGQTPEAYNGVNGQTISWGDNDNTYGGIEPADTSGNPWAHHFTVIVNIAAGVTGNQTVNFHVSGDGYGSSPGALVGTAIIFPAGASIIDASCTLSGVLGTTNCNNDSIPVGAIIKNLGNVTIQNVPVSFSIDGGTPVTEIVPDSIAPGDSVAYQFNTQGYFGAYNYYSVAVYTTLSGDLILSNDTNTSNYSNSTSYDLSTTPYANDFGTNQDFVSVVTQRVSGSTVTWGLSTTAQSGTYSLALVNTGGGGDAWLYLSCMDVTAGDNYRITYWKRTTTNYNGNLGISYGIDQDVAAMTNTIRPLTALNANSTWELDSVDFVAANTETIYIGFHGQGTASGSGTSVRFDNINIFRATAVNSVGDVNSADIVSVYPNPAKGQLNVRFTGSKGQIDVYDLLGNKVTATREAVRGNNLIDVTGLSNGTYFVKATIDGNVITRKVTVNN